MACVLCRKHPNLLIQQSSGCIFDRATESHRAKELEHPAWITFSCKSGTEVSSGDLLADCIKAVGSEWVIGALAEKRQDVSNRGPRGPPNSELRRKAPLSSNFSVL